MDVENKRNIILDNYQNPFHYQNPSNKEYIASNANNASCIDDINIYLKIKNNVVEDAYFDGEACAISISSSSIMLKNIIGKNLEEVKKYIENFEQMVNQNSFDENIVKDALVYEDIYKQQSRKTCALLPYIALNKIINK